MPERGEHLPKEQASSLGVHTAEAASPEQTSGCWLLALPSPPVQAASRLAGKASGAAGTDAKPPLMCVTDSLRVTLGRACLPAALLLQHRAKSALKALQSLPEY